jgi:hypothetical protein
VVEKLEFALGMSNKYPISKDCKIVSAALAIRPGAEKQPKPRMKLRNSCLGF